MIASIITFIIILIGTIPLTVFLRKRFEEVLPISIIGIVVIEYLFGLCHSLKFGVYVTIILYFYAAAITVFVLNKKIIQTNLKEYYSFVTVDFIILYFLLNIFNYGRVICAWDELSHWGDVVKVMAIYNHFGTIPVAESNFASYPPGMALLQYFTQSLNVMTGNGFSEWLLYVPYQIFTVSIAFPFLSRIENKKPIFIIAGSIVLVLMPSFFIDAFFRYVLIDTFLGVLFGVGIAFVICWPTRDAYYDIYTVLICVMLVLTKEIGVGLAAFVILFYAARLIIEGGGKRKNIAWILFALLSIITTWISWSHEVESSGCFVTRSGNHIDVQDLFLQIIGKGNQQSAEISSAFIHKLITPNFLIKNYGIQEPIYVVVVMLWIAMFVVLENEKNEEDKVWLRGRAIVILLGIGFFVYLIGMAVMWMYKMPDINLIGYERYVSIYLLGVFVFVVLNFLMRVKQINAKTIILTICFLAFVPWRSTLSIIDRQFVSDSLSIREQYQSMVDQYEEQIYEDNKRIFLIAQNDNGATWLQLHFLLRPNIIHNNPHMGELGWQYENNPQDSYMFNLSADEFRDELMEKYDLVVIFRADDSFKEKYSSIFSAPDKIGNRSIYTVDKTTQKLIFVPR